MSEISIQPSTLQRSLARRVLVVEDEPSVREMTTRLLERAGCSVVAVASGAEAIAILASLADPIDVVVTDVIMPGMTGLELAERVMERDPRVGLVLLSGYTAETLDVHEIVRRGAVFLAKPASTRQLVEAVQQAGALLTPVAG